MPRRARRRATTAPTPRRASGCRPSPPSARARSSRGPTPAAPCPRSGSRSLSAAQPTTLSTALWRPTSSRTHEQLAGLGVEQRRGVQPAGLVEHGLLGAERIGEADERRRIERHVVRRDVVRRHRLDRLDRRLAAQPARARRVEVAREVGVGRRDSRRERDVEHVVGVASPVSSPTERPWPAGRPCRGRRSGSRSGTARRARSRPPRRGIRRRARRRCPACAS